MEKIKAIQLHARVAGPIPGNPASSQICVRMVIQEEKGVKRRKKNILRRTVQPVAPIQQQYLNYLLTQYKSSLFIINWIMLTKAIVSLYTIGSGMLFLFPNILHKINKFAHPAFQQAIDNKRILNICHRGAPRIAPQNTLPSFMQGSKIGDVLQMDVCETKDEVLVIHHDLNLLRTCGVNKNIKDLSYSQLPILQEQIKLQFAEQGRAIKAQKQKIPTLQEVFLAFPNIAMNIELKTASQVTIINMMKLINKHNRRNITIVGVRGKKYEQLQFYDNKSIRFCSDRQVAKIIIAYFIGLLPYLPIKDKALQIPLFTQHFYQWKKRQWKNPFRTYAYFSALIMVNYLMIPLVWHLKKRGIMTFYWVCNNQQEFSRALSCGASGIITDEPFLLDKYLQGNKK